MSEGDVSLIQDEDVLRKMWQQTEDQGKRKEIRAHMYKLREERLKTLYSDSDTTDGKSLQFTSTGGHTDSFADQCFQSLKSKEVRDSESPTRDYAYQVQDTDNSNGGWTVESSKEISDDGATVTKSTKAHTSGTREIDGGKAEFAAVNESQNSVTNIEDENSKLFKAENVSKTMAEEHFESNDDDGTKKVSKTSTVGTSYTHKSSSQKFETGEDYYDDDSVVEENTSRNLNKGELQRLKNAQLQSNNIIRTTTESRTSNYDNSIPADGELVSRKIEHPDEFTKVTIETRKLPDGTMVTSTSRETKGSWTSKSGSKRNDNFDSSTATAKSTSERFVNKQLKSHIDSEKVISTDKIHEKKHTTVGDGQDLVTNYRTVTEHETNDNKVVRASDEIDRAHVDREVSENNEYSRKQQNVITENVVNVKSTSAKNIAESESHYEENKKEFTSKPHEVEEIVEVDKIYVTKSHPKPEEVDNVSDLMCNNKTTGEYSTTYTSDYTSKKISEDLSPTHNAWASSLRSGTPTTDSFVRGGSTRTSNSSLRSSISPEKYSPRNSYRNKSPEKMTPKDSYRNQSPEKKTSPTRSFNKTTKTVDSSKEYKNFEENKYGHQVSNDRKTSADYYKRSEKDKKTTSVSKSPSVSPQRKPSSPTRGYNSPSSYTETTRISNTRDYETKKDFTSKYKSPSVSPTRKPYLDSENDKKSSPSVSPTRTQRKNSYDSNTFPRSQSPNKGQYDTLTKKDYSLRSRDSSPTTSVSDIEFVSGSNKKIDTTENSSVTSRKSQETTGVTRKSSLKKTTNEYDNVYTNETSKLSKKEHEAFIDNEKHKMKPYTRSETYEERCRKILGMPDKKTLVEGAEKNLSEILGSFPSDQTPSKSPNHENLTTDRSPDRELTTGIKSAELIRKPSDNEVPRKSSLKKSIDTQNNQLLNLVDAEFIKIDESGKVVSLDDIKKSEKMINKNNKDVTTDFIKSEKQDYTNKKISQSSIRESKKEIIDEKKSTIDHKIRDKSPTKPKKEQTSDERSILAKYTKEEKITNKTSKSPSTSPQRKPSTDRSVSPNKPSPESRRSSSPKKVPTEINRSPSPQKKLSKEIQPLTKKEPTDSTRSRSVSPNKDTPKRSVSPKKSSDTNRSLSPKKEPLEKYTNKITNIETLKTKTTTERSTSPTKVNRSLSPQKKTTKKETCKTTTESNEKTVINKQSQISEEKKLSRTFPAKTTKVETTSTKKQPTRTILTSQKYDIFKGNNKTNDIRNHEDSSVKKGVTSSVNIKTKTVTQKNVTTQKLDKDKLKTFDRSQEPTKKKSPESIKKAESPTQKLQRSPIDSKKISNNVTDMKMTRTASDITMKTSKVEPTRVKSKPEITVSKSNVTKTTISTNVNTKTTTRTNSSSRLNTSTVTRTNSKQKIETNLNTGGIVNYQRATSSREATPDNVCPMPVSIDAINKDERPRFPDKITEPDDYVRNKKIIHEIISESDSKHTDRIVEVSDSDNDEKVYRTGKRKSLNESDECLLSVNEKVSKFSNIKESITQSDTNKYIQKKHVTDEVEEDLIKDDCLLSVSDKVSKFKTVSDIKKSTDTRQQTSDFIKREINSDVDKGRSSVTEKVSHFVSTAEKVIEPFTVSGSVKDNKSDRNSRKASLKISEVQAHHDDSERSPGLVSKATKMINDVKTKFETEDNIFNEIKLNVQKETVASQAKKSTAESANLKSQTTPDRTLSPKARVTPERTVSILKSTETVKKAKALFENIANQATEPEVTSKRATKLTDIGVYKKSSLADLESPIIESPVTKKHVSNLCHVESNEKNTKVKEEKKPTEIIHDKVKSHLTESNEINTKTKSKVTSQKITENQYNTKTFDNIKSEDVNKENFVSTRRGSGKFGVELRKTSNDQSYVSERRRSSVIETYLQSSIEEIFDLDLLEQMLEKVTGYELRRRIRGQIRIVKKNMENKQMSHIEQESRDISPTRKSKSTPITTEKFSSQTVKKTSHSSSQSTSPSRQSKPSSPDRKRSTSPVKKSSIKEVTKTINTTEKTTMVNGNKNYVEKEDLCCSPKSKSSKVSEYTTAYLRKIGASSNLKPEFQPKLPNIKKEKEESIIVEQQTTQSRKSSTTNEKVEITSSSHKSSYVESSRSTRSPSPRHSRSPVDRLAPRRLSPDLKRTRDDAQTTSELQNAYSQLKTKLSSKDLFKKSSREVQPEEKPEWARGNILRKSSKTETKTFSSKKVEEKNKTIRRSQSPTKTSRKATDVITSSYGVGPTDENGRPLFGIKALRKPATATQGYEVKGTVITKEFYSENGGEPEGQVTITKYSTDPTDLKNIVNDSNIKDSKVSHDLKKAIQDSKSSTRKGVSSITTTTRYSGTTGNPVSKIHKTSQSRAIESSPKVEHPTTGRRGSVKCLTEKFIKNAVETTKTERSNYPKAGLILRTNSFKDNASGSSRSSTPGVVRTSSNNSVNSTEMYTVEHRESSESHSSFLDNKTKVTGVKDIITRMKNADIVIEDGDTTEDAEARALLNKFLGATALMHGMTGYVEGKPQTKQCKKETRTVVKKTSTNVCADVDDIWDERILRKLLEESDDYEERRRIRARLRQVMAEQEACAQIVADAVEESSRESVEREHHNRQQSNEKSSTIETTTVEKVSTVTTKAIDGGKKPVSAFAKFRQLDRQNSSQSQTSTPSSPKTPLTPTGGGSPLFKFTDPKLQSSAANIKERLLQWCRDKTQEYENVKLDNFSTSWSDGLAFCALIHHFLPNEFDYSKLDEKHRRQNFTLAFKVADEKAGIYPLLDVEDMVTMRKPDWKCVFTYVQAIYRRFKDED